MNAVKNVSVNGHHQPKNVCPKLKAVLFKYSCLLIVQTHDGAFKFVLLLSQPDQVLNGFHDSGYLLIFSSSGNLFAIYIAHNVSKLCK